DLPNDVALCHELIRQQADSLDKAQRRIEQLEHAMGVLLRQKYGPRSERLDPNQLRLFTDEGDESASLFIRQFIPRKYACRSCQEHVATPPNPPQPIDKGLPGPGLLAHVITNKFAYHLPLYRQEQILAHHGVTISRSTLCGWLAQSAELF